jgi:upstream-binding transcription factor
LFQENASLEMVEEEQKKILKHEALQLLKKKEKADNIIKVSQIFTRNPCAWH